jgi:ElaB/YqjD/DUF883 family membrane-anchored ribosome-binding protein
MTDVTGGPVSGPQKDELRNDRPGESRAFAGTTGASGPTLGGPDRDARIRRAAAGAADAATEALARGDSLIADGLETAQAKAEEARRWAAEQGRTLRETVLEHPMTSCAAAFGGGLILGLLLARR